PPEAKVGKQQDLPVPLLHRIACAHLIDNVRGQTSPFEESQVKKARLSTEVTAVDGDVVSLRLEGETRTAMEGRREHGLDMLRLGWGMGEQGAVFDRREVQRRLPDHGQEGACASVQQTDARSA